MTWYEECKKFIYNHAKYTRYPEQFAHHIYKLIKHAYEENLPLNIEHKEISEQDYVHHHIDSTYLSWRNRAIKVQLDTYLDGPYPMYSLTLKVLGKNRYLFREKTLYGNKEVLEVPKLILGYINDFCPNKHEILVYLMLSGVNLSRGNIEI